MVNKDVRHCQYRETQQYLLKCSLFDLRLPEATQLLKDRISIHTSTHNKLRLKDKLLLSYRVSNEAKQSQMLPCFYSICQIGRFWNFVHVLLLKHDVMLPFLRKYKLLNFTIINFCNNLLVIYRVYKGKSSANLALSYRSKFPHFVIHIILIPYESFISIIL